MAMSEANREKDWVMGEASSETTSGRLLVMLEGDAMFLLSLSSSRRSSLRSSLPLTSSREVSESEAREGSCDAR